MSKPTKQRTRFEKVIKNGNPPLARRIIATITVKDPEFTKLRPDLPVDPNNYPEWARINCEILIKGNRVNIVDSYRDGNPDPSDNAWLRIVMPWY